MSSRFASNTTFSVVAGLFSQIGRFAVTIIIARLLGADGTGAVTFAIWVAGIAAAFSDLGAYSALTRYLPEVARSEGPGNARQLASYLLLPFSFLTLVGLLGFVLWSIILMFYIPAESGSDIKSSPWVWVMVACFYVAQNFYNFGLGYLQGMQRFRDIAALSAASSCIQLIVTIGGCLIFGVPGALLGYLSGFLLIAVSVCGVPGAGHQVVPQLRKRILRYSAYSWAGALANALLWARPEVAVINHYWGNGAVGFYTIAFTLAALAVQGPMLLTGGLVPYFAERVGSDRHGEIETMISSGSRIITFMMVPLCFGAAAICAPLISLIYGAEFADAAPAAVALLCSASISGVSAVLSGVIIGTERSDFVFYSNVIGAAIMLLLSWIFIPRYGFVGAAVLRGVIQVALFILTLWFVSERLRFKVPALDLLRLVVAGLGCFIAAAASFRLVEGYAGLVLAVGMGATAYFVLVRMVGGLHGSDIARLSSLLQRVPDLPRRIMIFSLSRLATARSA